MLRLLVVLALMAPGIGLAQSRTAIPDWDPVAYCQRSAAAIGQGDSEFMRSACLQQEQASYDGLKARWEEQPETARRNCVRNTRTINITSYFMLQACLQQEEASRQQNQQFQFRR